MTRSLLHTVVPIALLVNVSFAEAQGATAKKPAPASAGAAVASSTVPGGAVLSRAVITATSVRGGSARNAVIAADGAFSLTGLAPGRYRVALTTARQTQGATFGEKVNAGLQAAGSAVSQGAKVDPNSMPSRLSMNVTVARTSHVLEVDGAAVEIEVGADGRLSGVVKPK